MDSYYHGSTGKCEHCGTLEFYGQPECDCGQCHICGEWHEYACDDFIYNDKDQGFCLLCFLRMDDYEREEHGLNG